MNAKGLYFVATMVATALGLFASPTKVVAAPGGDIVNINTATQTLGGTRQVTATGTFVVAPGRTLVAVQLIIVNGLGQIVSTTPANTTRAPDWNSISNALPPGNYGAYGQITTKDACGGMMTTGSPTGIAVTIN